MAGGITIRNEPRMGDQPVMVSGFAALAWTGPASASVIAAAPAPVRAASIAPLPAPSAKRRHPVAVRRCMPRG